MAATLAEIREMLDGTNELKWAAMDERGVPLCTNVRGDKYEDIPRDKVATFHIGVWGQYFIIRPIVGQHPHNLIYRLRQSVSSTGEKSTRVIAGYPDPSNRRVHVIDYPSKVQVLELGSDELHDINYREQESSCLMET